MRLTITISNLNENCLCLMNSFLSFRLHFPVFGGSGRVLSKDITFSGYNIPKGVSFFSSNHTIHLTTNTIIPLIRESVCNTLLQNVIEELLLCLKCSKRRPTLNALVHSPQSINAKVQCGSHYIARYFQ